MASVLLNFGCVFPGCDCQSHQCVGCERTLRGPGVVCVACLEFEAAELWPGEGDEYVAAEHQRRMANA